MVIHHINKGKTLQRIPTDIENAFNKIQYTFIMIKALKLGTAENDFNIIKSINEKHKAHSILNGQRTESIPLNPQR